MFCILPLKHGRAKSQRCCKLKGFNPKNDAINNILKRMAKDGATFTQPSLANQLSKHKRIQNLRQQNKFFIGKDRRKKKSVLFYTGKIRIDGNGIHFE